MDYINTFTGETFKPLEPEQSKIHIEDIAHALSLQCRANGHIVHFFSIAQHSINCANEAKARGLSLRTQRACLLHDASEAYLSDVIRPVKRHLSNYGEIEKRVQDEIFTKFLGRLPTSDELTHIDKIDDDMLICEFIALMGRKIYDRCPMTVSDPSFDLVDFAAAENEFIEIFNSTAE